MAEINEIAVAEGNPAYCSADGILYSADQKKTDTVSGREIRRGYDPPDDRNHFG
jgi:hypothetical protein